MLDRELTYPMPYKRLRKVGRIAGRPAFAAPWGLLILILFLYLAALALLDAFDEHLREWLESRGLPEMLPIALLFVALLLAVWLLRRFGHRQSEQRADYEATVRFRQEMEGVRVITPEIEYFIRWQGLSQVLLLEKDGVLFSHGNLFFLVPNGAFRDNGERDVLVSDAFSRLSQAARQRSERFVPAALRQDGGTVRS